MWSADGSVHVCSEGGVLFVTGVFSVRFLGARVWRSCLRAGPQLVAAAEWSALAPTAVEAGRPALLTFRHRASCI